MNNTPTTASDSMGSLCETEPCPWCNGKAFAQSPSLGRSHWNVVCDDCGAEGPHGHDEAMAIRRWNDRACSPDESPHAKERIAQHRPHFPGVSTPEPSLRSIIYGYYREYWPAKDTERLTEKYLDAIRLASPNASRGEKWRTGFDKPDVQQRHRDAAAWALDKAPDGLTWENLTASHVSPDRLWQANRVTEAFARFERALSQPNASNGVSEGWNEAIEAAAEAARQTKEPLYDDADDWVAPYNDGCTDCIAAIRALAKPLTDQKAGS